MLLRIDPDTYASCPGHRGFTPCAASSAIFIIPMDTVNVIRVCLKRKMAELKKRAGCSTSVLNPEFFLFRRNGTPLARFPTTLAVISIFHPIRGCACSVRTDEP
jgi:hypothetical protein